MQRKRTAGVEVRHAKGCESRSGGSCSCEPSFRGSVYDRRISRPVKGPWVVSEKEARDWRDNTAAELRLGIKAKPISLTLQQAATAHIKGMEAGTVLTMRGGRTYKPGVVRSYRHSLQNHIVPALGKRRLTDLTKQDVQALVIDAMLGQGFSGSTVRNAVKALSAVYGEAMLTNRDLKTNPCQGVRLPAANGKRLLIVAPEDAERLLSVLDGTDAAVWALGFHAGLRRGEIRALRWGDVDLSRRRIRVEWGWDDQAGRITTKSVAGTREVAIFAPLLARLKAHLGQRIPHSEEPVFDAAIFWGLHRRARTAWKQHKLAAIFAGGTFDLHGARHTAASVMLHAGVPISSVSKMLGHSSVTVTVDRYGHLLPNSLDELVTHMDSFFERRLALS